VASRLLYVAMITDELKTPLPLLHVSLVAPGVLRDRSGAQLGRVVDLIVRLDQPGYPAVTGVLAAIERRQSFVPADQIGDIQSGAITLSRERLDLRPFQRREGEVLLRKDVLDRQLINVEGARLVRTNDIELGRVGQTWRVLGVDTSLRGALRRLLPRKLAGRVGPGHVLDWAYVEPFLGHVPTVRLKVPHAKLARLHPAQIADLIEAASHREGDEIIQAVAHDRELEADVFEELDPQHQREFLDERSDAEIAKVLERMAGDDAADVLVELDEDRREGALSLLPEVQRRELRTLLGFDPATAGGLMTTEAIVLDEYATVGQALELVRTGAAASTALGSVCVIDAEQRLRGLVTLIELVQSPAEAELGSLAISGPIRVAPDADVEEVARLMADFNVTAVPVIDEEQRVMGIVTVDDVLEVALPKRWRRRFGLLGAE